MDDRTFVDILRDRAQVSSDKIAYRFLVDGDKQELTLTYGQLHQRALAIAARLKAEAKPGDRALLLYPQGLEFICAFFGCLYAGVIAVPAYPPNPHRLQSSMDRLEIMVQDADPSLILGTSAILSIIRLNAVKDGVLHVFKGRHKNTSMSRSLAQLKKINTEKITVSQSSIILPYEAKANELAYLQYTSGSTGNPKGVMISHSNTIDNTHQIHSRVFESVDFMVSWLPLYHDMGLINTLFMPLRADIDVKFFSPIDFLKEPIRWLNAISSPRNCYSGGPNFSFEYLLKKTTSEQLEQIRLDNWILTFTGAEPVCENTLNRFINRFTAYGFKEKSIRPVYGLAEATAAVTCKYSNMKMNVSTLCAASNDLTCRKDMLKGYVCCGSIATNHIIKIVDLSRRLVLGEEKLGEIWLQGASVAQGYWGNEEATKETFQAYTADGQGPFLRTGDLGFMKDGELYVVGRLKDMIIIRGRNYAPQDVEYAVETAHDGIRKGCVAAFGFEERGVEKLGVVCEVKRTYIKKNHNDIIQSIIQNITRENELSVSAIVLLKSGQIYKTTSGKIQRRKTKQAFLTRSLSEVYRWETTTVQSEKVPTFSATHDTRPMREQLKMWMAQQLDKDSSEIADDASFSSLGLDSIQTLEAAESLSNALGLEFKVSYFFEYPTVGELASYLDAEIDVTNSNSISQDLDSISSLDSACFETNMSET